MSMRVLGAVLLAVCVLSATAWGKTTIKLGVVTKPGSAQNICAEKFKELLEARSQGECDVTIYHSASLGTETEILEQIQLNSVQMGIITDGPFDVFLPEVRVISYPFLFANAPLADKVLDGPAGRELLQRLEKVGMKGLAFSENGFRHVTNSKRPVHTVAEVAGLKIRVMESLFHKELWRLLGANPTPMGWPIYTELQQGTIDAQENPLSVIWTYKLFEVQKYLTLTGHVYSSHIDVANLKWFQGLPAGVQDLIQQCMTEAVRTQRAWNRTNEADFLAKLKAAGMEVDEHPDLDSFRSKVVDIRDTDVFKGQEVREMLDKFLQVARE
jgi:tripartite ATP-independent transporter DctP family solute receptor